MGRKRLLDVVINKMEDRLDKNGALRNVAVKDSWQRLRQNIEVVRQCFVLFISYFSDVFAFVLTT